MEKIRDQSQMPQAEQQHKKGSELAMVCWKKSLKVIVIEQNKASIIFCVKLQELYFQVPEI